MVPRSDRALRLHYLDWLQVLAVLGVFLFHSVHPFDDLADWHIKNVERSALVAFERVERAMEELDKFEGGTILRHTLSDEVYQQLSDAVED